MLREIEGDLEVLFIRAPSTKGILGRETSLFQAGGLIPEMRMRESAAKRETLEELGLALGTAPVFDPWDA